ncbi:GNAT family N-acetyltransferase [Polyangium aurulentum]|uniref:GNAT family N-acetyltransferase n=1 Tax=Polyangium aurulentum TaxID=2567896 RepID=UPI0010AE2A37|nr:GNAT family N-acetyltransferase [Polyangium aurulentum]UQA56886.1 GNAT family N-acetyltransferase [Polyangium aurulentum]
MTRTVETFPLVDLTLSRRLERTEGHANAVIVDSRGRLEPSTGAIWKDIGGTYALFDGVGSPLTQTFGLGMFSEPDGAQFEAIEAFFAERGAPALHEVSPLADPSLLSLFAERGYRPIELTSLLYQPLVDRALPSIDPGARVTVRRIDGQREDEADGWAAVAAEGWGETPEVAAFVRDLGRVSARALDTHCFVAELDGRPIGTGSMHVHEGVALLAGASTIPQARRLGGQRALLAARLRFAVDAGCDLAMMGAAPGSASQRNAERQGFRIAYTRIKWGR